MLEVLLHLSTEAHRSHSAGHGENEKETHYWSQFGDSATCPGWRSLSWTNARTCSHLNLPHKEMKTQGTGRLCLGIYVSVPVHLLPDSAIAQDLEKHMAC